MTPRQGYSRQDLCFNPWYVGGGVKRQAHLGKSLMEISFNPWYVGGGVKRVPHPAPSCCAI